jgi:hypothetical protein
MPGFRFVDDMKDHQAIVSKFESLSIRKVYPGHEKPLCKGLQSKEKLYE